LAAGSGNNITLNNSGNDFSTVGITSGNNISLRDTNGLALAASTVSGTFDVIAAGALTQSGALGVTGATTFAAGSSNNITLTNAANDFSTFAITSGKNVSVTDANALTLGASTISGDFTVNTHGALTQSGELAMNGAGSTAAFTSNNNVITLNNTINGAINLTLDSGSSDITINQNLGDTTQLAALNVTNANNFTSNATIRASNFIQSGGSGITLFNNSGLIADNAIADTTTLNGALTVGTLTFDIHTGNMTGTVNGQAGDSAILAMNILNIVVPNTIYFNGIDVYYVLNPTPTPTPTPSTETTQTAAFQIVFPTDFNGDDPQPLKTEATDVDSKTTNLIKIQGNCVQAGANTSICASKPVITGF